MSVKINKGSALDSLNLTPMIDCVFLLLIFFLVSSEFEKEEQRALQIKLPQASEAMPMTAKPKEMFVNVDERGQFFVQNQLVNESELFAALQQAWANNPGRQKAIIRGDKRCPWQYVVTVMNLCNKAGIHDYQVTTLGPDG
jgi:biopolymer transport protein ExbD